jgi:hypothetical protein
MINIIEGRIILNYQIGGAFTNHDFFRLLLSYCIGSIFLINRVEN